MIGRILSLASALVLAACAATAQPAAPAQAPRPPLTAAEQEPRAQVVIAPYRFDDVLFENDRAAYRIYGRPLEAREPPSGSGIDAWGKRVRYPYMERQLRAGNYHDDLLGEGNDFYNVGRSRGIGGLGIWYDNKLWTSRNYRAVRILENGPRAARFETDYAPWPVDVDRRVWETRRFELPMGANLIRMTSTLQSDSAEPLIVGIGLARAATGASSGEVTFDRAHGVMTSWGPVDAAHGVIAGAVIVDPAMVVDQIQDAENFLLLIRVTPGQPFVYYAGAGWDQGPDFSSRAAWEAYVRAQALDFTAR